MIGISIRVVFVKHGHTPRGAIEVNHNLVVAMPQWGQHSPSGLGRGKKKM